MEQNQQNIIDSSNHQNNLLARIATLLDKFLVYISIILSAVLTINLIVAVLFRYVLSMPIFWADELSLLLFAWITFLGGCLAIKRSEMAAVTMILDRLSSKLKLIFQIIIQLSILFFTIIIAYYSYIWVTSPSVSNMISSTLRIEMWWIYSIVPISMVCIFIFTINNLYNHILEYRFRDKGGC
ncbi:TRAP transporter small permease [Pueribacillus theae]|uniref:TRAP transporter small permease n=1 Tax=Pueribacillus theae TaxID=2171751 RepID=A0A2U1JIX8_9BACI|nr:TRAP transporter small permease [Pueribacillus theae]PWA05116.1 TRAP transporter small permease [Pueribacillus theae]